MEFLIDEILPTCAVHLVSGPSGAGKTTWLIDTLQQWQRGEAICGCASHPVPYVYIAADRTRRDMERTLKRLGIDPSSFPLYIPTQIQLLTAQVTQIMDAARAEYRTWHKARHGVEADAKLIIIDGLAFLMPGQASENERRAVFLFIRGTIVSYCEKNDVTVIGITHTAKQREGERYERARERLAGSSAWAATVNTIFLLEPVDQEGVGGARTLYILGRDIAERKYNLDWLNGRLVATYVPQRRLANGDKLTLFVAHVEPNERGQRVFTFRQAHEATAIPESSLYLELERMRKAGAIVPISKGVYLIARDVEN